MKGAYINFVFSPIIGVEKKIKQEKKAIERICKSEKLNIDIYIFNTKKTQSDGILKYVNMFEVSKSDFEKRMPYFIRKMLLFFLYGRYLSEIFISGDYYFLLIRYYCMDFSLLTFVKKCSSKCKIISQHHTKELDEFKSTLSFSLKGLKGFIKFFLEKYLARYGFKYIDAIVGVTDEIVEYQQNRLNFHKKTFTMPNGIDVESIDFTGFQPFDGKKLKLLFVASYFAPWHGLDILLKILTKQRLPIKVELHLVGNLPESYLRWINKINKNSKLIKVIHYGVLSGKHLTEVFKKVNIGISSLALFRNKMKEASTLKTREYIARGLPFVYGYIDSDLKGDENFALRVNPFNFTVEDIIVFAKKVSTQPNLSYQMRKFAFEKLDWYVKWKSFFKFIQNELGQ